MHVISPVPDQTQNVVKQFTFAFAIEVCDALCHFDSSFNRDLASYMDKSLLKMLKLVIFPKYRLGLYISYMYENNPTIP